MDDHHPNPEDLRRKRHAERLRRAYEASGREQNQIFESLAEYTHEVQAEVRALQIARDHLYAERVPHAGSPGAPAPRRYGRPVVLVERWISVEAVAVGIVICGVLGLMLGIQGLGRRQDKRSGATMQKGKSRRNLHDD